jgi:hypothetical protein
LASPTTSQAALTRRPALFWGARLFSPSYHKRHCMHLHLFADLA